MKYKQVIELESQETNINIDYCDKKIRIYTNKAVVMSRMSKAGYKAIKMMSINGDTSSASYEFSFKDFSKFIRSGIFRCG